MFLALIIIVLVAPIILVIRDPRLRRVIFAFMAALLVLAFTTERFGSYIPMGAVLIGMPALVIAAATTITIHFMRRERWFYLSLITALLANALVLYIYQFVLATPCTNVYPQCAYHTITFDLGTLASFVLFAYAHWLSWLQQEVQAIAPVKVTKRNTRRRTKKTRVEIIVEHLNALKRPVYTNKKNAH